MKKQLDIERLDSSMDGATSPTTRPISGPRKEEVCKSLHVNR